MPRFFTERDIIGAWSRSYGEDLREEADGFLEILNRDYGIKNYTRRSHVSPRRTTGASRPKRKLSAWNKFVKANSNKKKFQYANGKLKLKKMGIAYRKKKR